MGYPVDSAIQPLNNRSLVRVTEKVDNTIHWIYLYLFIESLLVVVVVVRQLAVLFTNHFMQ